MKINFFRRGISYSILKENVLRVVDTKVIEKIEATNISVKIIDGQPTFLLEPFQIFFSGGEERCPKRWPGFQNGSLEAPQIIQNHEKMRFRKGP